MRFVPEAFVNDTPWRPVWPVTFRVLETFTAPVALKVATWRFPLPVAFVKVMPVEETVVASKVPIEKFPAAVTVPVAETENLEELFTWKSTKFPLYPEKGLAPIRVPDTFPAWIEFGPSCTKEADAF